MHRVILNAALRCASTLPRTERGMLRYTTLQRAVSCEAVALSRRTCSPGSVWSRATRLHQRQASRSLKSPRASASTSGDTEGTPSTIIGRVMSAQANFVRVKVEQTGDGEPFTESLPPPQTRLLCVVRALLKKMKRRVLVGDMVRVVGIDWVDGRGMVEDVFPRTSKLDEPPVSNISRIMLVFSLAMPPFMPSAATRYLVSAEYTGLPVTVVLNKCDLVLDKQVQDEVSRMEAWGYDCVAVSVQKGAGTGLGELEERLKGDVTVVAGPSGAGKSSIINALSLRSSREIEDGADQYDLQDVGDVSERVGRGKHTTRNVTIIELAGGGALVDTPGFNQPTLSFPSTDLESCFPEIRARLDRVDAEGNKATCAFKNCRHISEPGCIVRGETKQVDETGTENQENSDTVTRATSEPEELDETAEQAAGSLCWERYPYYVELLQELQATEEHLAKRAAGKHRREGTARRKTSAGGIDREEARLETKTHRRTSRRSVKQEISVLNPENAEDYDGSFEIK